MLERDRNPLRADGGAGSRYRARQVREAGAPGDGRSARRRTGRQPRDRCTKRARSPRCKNLTQSEARREISGPFLCRAEPFDRQTPGEGVGQVFYRGEELTARLHGQRHIDIMKRWPQSQSRREIVMITDGVDRAGRERNALLNPDVDSAADVAQRTGTIIHTIHSPGVGRWHRNFWIGTNGENGIAKLSDITGGESYFLSLQSPVSFEPYLKDIQRMLDNQYLLSFAASPGNKAGFQRISVDTELPGVDLSAADSVWVPVTR